MWAMEEASTPPSSPAQSAKATSVNFSQRRIDVLLENLANPGPPSTCYMSRARVAERCNLTRETRAGALHWRRKQELPAVTSRSQPYYLIPTLAQGCLLAASFMLFRIIYIPFSGVPQGTRRDDYVATHSLRSLPRRSLPASWLSTTEEPLKQGLFSRSGSAGTDDLAEGSAAGLGEGCRARTVSGSLSPTRTISPICIAFLLLRSGRDNG